MKKKKKLEYTDNQYFSAFRRHRRENRNLKHCINEKLHNVFLIRKVLSKVGVCSEYCVTSRIIEEMLSSKVPEFDRGKIFVYQDCKLSFRDITHHISRIIMQICYQWFVECNIKQHARSQCPNP